MNDRFMQLMEEQNKKFKRDIIIFIIMLSWSIPFLAWCIAQIINRL